MLKLAKRLARSGVNRLIVAASRGRVAGETGVEAWAVARELLEGGYSVTLAHWNQDDDAPEAIVSRYEETLDLLATAPGRAYLSVKAPAFGFDPGLYTRLLAKARRLGVPLHFDALGPESADRTFSLIEDCTPPPFTDMGCTLPGRWKRSVADADRAAALGLAVRVVKGEWADPEDPAADPAAGVLAVMERLAGRARTVRVATHDPCLARASIGILRDAATPCDLEILHGFPVREILSRVEDLSVPIRVYVPFGRGWVSYCWKHVRARPGFLWWLLRDSLAGRYSTGFMPRRAPSIAPALPSSSRAASGGPGLAAPAPWPPRSRASRRSVC